MEGGREGAFISSGGRGLIVISDQRIHTAKAKLQLIIS